MTNLAVSTEDLSPPEDFPLDNVLEGKPDATVRWLQSGTNGDGQLSGIFSCEPCILESEYPDGESSFLLEGKMTVAIEGGATITLKAGDVASFPKGTKATCQIHEPIKQFFVING